MFHDRTPHRIFIETAVHKDQNKEVAKNLYTPFGRVTLVTGGWDRIMEKVSDDFMNSLTWDVEDVTKTIKTAYYDPTEQKVSDVLKMRAELYPGSGIPLKVYLLKDDVLLNKERENEIDKEVDKEDLMVFRNVGIDIHQSLPLT